jgi:hypothetical protein
MNASARRDFPMPGSATSCTTAPCARRRGVGEERFETPAFDFASHERRARATGRAQRAQLP